MGIWSAIWNPQPPKPTSPSVHLSNGIDEEIGEVTESRSRRENLGASSAGNAILDGVNGRGLPPPPPVTTTPSPSTTTTTTTMDSEVFRIGVVGGGASATSFCIQLYSKLRHQELRYPSGVELLVFERGERVGPGLAYTIHPDGDTFRLNRSKDSMDPYAGRIGQFSAWLAEHGDEEARASDFPPRSAYGRYLVHLLDELKRVSERPGSRLHVGYLTRTAVNDIAVLTAATPTGGDEPKKQQPPPKYVLNVEGVDGPQRWEVNAVVLCTGHYPVSSYRHFIGLPNYACDYPNYRRLIAQLAGTDVDVGIIGSSTTMVDIATELQRRGHRGKIVTGSRMGILPSTDEPISIKVFEKELSQGEKTAITSSSASSSAAANRRPSSAGFVSRAYTNEPYVGACAEFRALSEGNVLEATTTSAVALCENGDDGGGGGAVETKASQGSFSRPSWRLRQFIKRSGIHQQKSLKIKQICGFAVSRFSATQRRASLQRSLICTTPLVTTTASAEDLLPSMPAAVIITFGPASQTMRRAVNSYFSSQSKGGVGGGSGEGEDGQPNLRYYCLTHLNPDTLPRPVRIDDVVERVFREISDLQGSPITFDDVLAMYREQTPLEVMSRAIDTTRPRRVKPWQLVLFTLGPLFLELWDLMSDEERRIYYRRYNALLFRYLGFIPLMNARKLRAMLEEGRLRVLRELEPVKAHRLECNGVNEEGGEKKHKARAEESEDAATEMSYEMCGMEGNVRTTYHVKVLFNASGLSGTPKDILPLANMLKSGLLSMHHLGGLRINRDTHQTLDANGSVNECIYAMGEATKGHYFISADLPTVAEQAEKVACEVARKLLLNGLPFTEEGEENEAEAAGKDGMGLMRKMTL